jgi:RNA polymerase sigma-70 factor (ECF subfamily)
MYCADSQKRKDLQQDILLQPWISMDRYDGRVKLSTWIYRVALNTSITFYHSDNKYQSRRQNLDSSIFVYADEGGESVLDENIKLLNRLIQQLSVNDRAVMLLYLDKVKHKDIAEIM